MNNSEPTGLSKSHFTLEELEEINRDMEHIMRLTDLMKDGSMPYEGSTRSASNIYPLRPDIILP